MIKTKALASIALCAVISACSGGGSESGEPGAAEEAVEATPAAEEDGTEAAASDAPAEETAADALDSMTTKDGVDYASLTGDATAGKLVFAQCRACHVTDPAVNRTGPTLAAIVGAKAGAVDGYKYSSANQESGLTWTEEQLYVYLENPQRIVPKTKMIFAGLPDAQKRADVIAYLKDPS